MSSSAYRHAAKAARVARKAERFAERAVWCQQTRQDRWSSPSSASREARKQAAAADKAVNKRVLGAVLLALGSNWLLAELGLFPGGAKGLLAVALVTLGIAMIGTAKAGRTKPLVALGVVLTVLLAMSSSLASPVAGPFIGSRAHAPSTVAQLQSNYNLGVGELTLDLSGLQLDSTDGERVSASLGIGDLTVIVPAGVSLTIDAAVGLAGDVTVLGQGSEGFRPDVSYQSTADGSPPLALELDVSTFGDITVHERAS